MFKKKKSIAARARGAIKPKRRSRFSLRKAKKKGPSSLIKPAAIGVGVLGAGVLAAKSGIFSKVGKLAGRSSSEGDEAGAEQPEKDTAEAPQSS
jgi:hypothetical protein